MADPARNEPVKITVVGADGSQYDDKPDLYVRLHSSAEKPFERGIMVEFFVNDVEVDRGTYEVALKTAELDALLRIANSLERRESSGDEQTGGG
jgi:hypothetical protein